MVLLTASLRKYSAMRLFLFTVNRIAKENKKKGPQAAFDDLRSTERFSKKGSACVIQNYQMSMQALSPGSAARSSDRALPRRR